jgi:hypothetical protein
LPLTAPKGPYPLPPLQPSAPPWPPGPKPPAQGNALGAAVIMLALFDAQYEDAAEA